MELIKTFIGTKLCIWYLIVITWLALISCCLVFYSANMCPINTSSDCHHLNVFFDVFVGFRQWRWYPFYICTLVCLLQTINALSSSAKHVHTAIDNATHRLNYGTIFKSMGNLHFSREYWLQTFRFKSQIKVETYNQSFTIIRWPYHKIEPRRNTRSLLLFVGSQKKSLWYCYNGRRKYFSLSCQCSNQNFK